VWRAIYVAPFGELADPLGPAGLAVAAEERGWDGFFVWDHIVYCAPVRAVADPWGDTRGGGVRHEQPADRAAGHPASAAARA
jgi:hypothetical protein